MKIKNVLFVAAALLPAIFTTSVHAGEYFQDFSGFSAGATSLDDGSTFSSTALGTVASVVDSTYKELQMTAIGTANVQSAFMLPDLDPGVPVYAFAVKWNAVIDGDFPNAADGFSFNFGALSSLNLLSTNLLAEAGFSNGLCFAVQTYQYNNPGFYVKVNGAVIASNTYTAVTEWGIQNTTRHLFEADWNYATGLSVEMDGAPIFSNVAVTNYTPHAGNVFAWGARSGGLTEYFRLDNIVVVTGGNLAKVTTTAYFANNLVVNPASDAFDGNTNTYWSQIGQSGYVGATVAPASTVVVYTMTSPPSSGAYGPPGSWSLQGSSNGGSTWTALDNPSAQWVNPFETRSFLAMNNTAYSAYELNIFSAANSPELGLAELALYQFTAVLPPAAWTQTGAPSKGWTSVASSADGTKVVAVYNDGNYDENFYTSTDSGATWTQQTSSPGLNFVSVASSADGSKLASVFSGGTIYTSTNGGTNWIGQSAPEINWEAISSSEDGNKLAAAASGYEIEAGFVDYMYTSTDAGVTWTQQTGSGKRAWKRVACSSDGSKIVAAVQNGVLYRSADSGVTWSALSTTNAAWNSIASSADGSKLVAVASGVLITSGDSGNTWTTQAGAPTGNLSSVASSSDGNTLEVTVNGGGIYKSTNAGVNWTQFSLANHSWTSIAGSTNGMNLVAAGGTIWHWGTVAGSPVATTLPASSVTAATATINGSVNNFDIATSAWLVWGTTTSYGHTNSFSIGANLNVVTPLVESANLTGLTPLTTYHFAIFAAPTANPSAVNTGADLTFTTAGGPPVITTRPASAVSFTSATLNGQVNPNYLATGAYFNWGTTVSYGNTTAVQSLGNGSSAVGANANLSGLTPGQTYHFQVVATNSQGTSLGLDSSFTNRTFPSLAAALATNQLTLSWPASATNFSLQYKTNLADAAWLPVTNAPDTNGGTISLVEPIGAGTSFFRLIDPNGQ